MASLNKPKGNHASKNRPGATSAGPSTPERSGVRGGDSPHAKDEEDQPITPRQLTRLVRFSMLQARRSSQAKPSNVADNRLPPGSGPEPSKIAMTSQTHSPQNPPVIGRTPAAAAEPKNDPVLQGFFTDKERPSTEVAHHYNSNQGIGAVDVGTIPNQPNIVLSASLTLSIGELASHSVTSESDEQYMVGNEDMHLLLAPDSGSMHELILGSESNDIYNSADEMFTSGSENYDDESHYTSSDISTDSSDSIMRRVEEEIANARKASSDAQARLAYFTSKHKSHSVSESYSFDFESLQTSGDLQSMLDVGDEDENFENAMGVIGQEFDSAPPAEVEEKVDIEVVLAPSSEAAAPRKAKKDKSSSSPKKRTKKQTKEMKQTQQHNSMDDIQVSHSNRGATNRHIPAGPQNDFPDEAENVIDMEEAAISAVFSERSIETLPMKEGITAVFSDRSTGSLAAQGNQGLGSEEPGFQPLPDCQRVQNFLPKISQKEHGRNKATKLALEHGSDSDHETMSSSVRDSKRTPPSPSYRERLENKLKMLGSRYPVSPASPTKGGDASVEAFAVIAKAQGVLQVRSTERKGDKPLYSDHATPNGSPKKIGSASPKQSVTSPLLESYDGLENRIKDLLARTLHTSTTVDSHMSKDRDIPHNPSSPSAELKAIKHLLEKGIATEKKKRKKGKSSTEDLLVPDIHQNEFLDREERHDRQLLTVAKSTDTKSAIRDAEFPSDTGVPPIPAAASTVTGADASVSVRSEPGVEGSTSEEILEQLETLSLNLKARNSSSMSVARAKTVKDNDYSKNANTNPRPLDQAGYAAREDTAEPKQAIPADPNAQDPRDGESSSITDRNEKIKNLPDQQPGKDEESEPISILTSQDDPPASATRRQNRTTKPEDPPEQRHPATKIEAQTEFHTRSCDSANENEANTMELSPSKMDMSKDKQSQKNQDSDREHDSQNRDASSEQNHSNAMEENVEDPASSSKQVNDDEGIIETSGHESSEDLLSVANGTSTSENPSNLPICQPEEPQSELSTVSNAKQGDEQCDTTSIDEEELPQLSRRQNQVSPEAIAGSAHSDSANKRRIRFRDPYPTPKPCRKPRSTTDIKRDNSSKPSLSDRQTARKEPKGDLKRLLTAAMDTSLPRRSNACGALKVISKSDKNKAVLVRTNGFLKALVFVAGADIVSSDEMEVMEDARARAISSLYNVSHVKENRFIVCSQPGLLECLVKVIKDDSGEARMEACGVLAQLAKSPICREYMALVDGLLSTLASILRGTIDKEEQRMDVLSEDVTATQSSESETSSVMSDDQTANTKPRSPRRTEDTAQLHPNCSIRKQKSEMHDQYLGLARLSSCAALLHLSKQCSILDHFSQNSFLLESIVEVTRDSDSQLHCKCLEILCNASRLPSNNAAMTIFPGLVDTLIAAGKSKHELDRVWALRTLQNLTSDESSKAILATSPLLTLLITCVTSKVPGEQHAAMASLLNLSTDPSAVVPITSTKNVLATLVYLAHNSETASEIRLMACNALATVGLWLQTVSGFGTIPIEIRKVLLPSHKTTGWESWE